MKMYLFYCVLFFENCSAAVCVQSMTHQGSRLDGHSATRCYFPSTAFERLSLIKTIQTTIQSIRFSKFRILCLIV